MDLSKKCKAYWGFHDHLTPFGNRIENGEALFTWSAFDDVVARLLAAMKRRSFAVLAGSACSAKTTAWNEAQRRQSALTPSWHCCQPRALDVSCYTPANVLRAVWETIRPSGDDTKFRQDREARARQVRQLLERENDARHPVCLAVNDAHACRQDFLLVVKRLWDDLYGFDRLLSVVLVGQRPLVGSVRSIPEIADRAEVLTMGGLGDSLADYIAWEFRRCCLDANASIPLSDDAVEELAKLKGPNWWTTRDHPLIVNNVMSAALDCAWRVKAGVIDRDIVARVIARTADATA